MCAMMLKFRIFFAGTCFTTRAFAFDVTSSSSFAFVDVDAFDDDDDDAFFAFPWFTPPPPTTTFAPSFAPRVVVNDRRRKRRRCVVDGVDGVVVERAMDDDAHFIASRPDDDATA